MKKFLISFILLLMCIAGCNNSKQFDIEDFTCFNTNFENSMKQVKKDCKKNSGIKLSEEDDDPSDNLTHLSGYGSFFDVDCNYYYTFEDDKLTALNIITDNKKYTDEDEKEIFYKINNELKNIYGNPDRNTLDEDDKFVAWEIDNNNSKIFINLFFYKENNYPNILLFYFYINENESE